MNDWLKRTLKILPFVAVAIFMTIYGLSCSPQFNEKPEITEAQRRANTKLMPTNQHSMKVPIGTQIGDTITCYDGIWLSEKACTNLAAAIKIAEQIKKKTLEDVTRRK